MINRKTSGQYILLKESERNAHLYILYTLYTQRVHDQRTNGQRLSYVDIFIPARLSLFRYTAVEGFCGKIIPIHTRIYIVCVCIFLRTQTRSVLQC